VRLRSHKPPPGHAGGVLVRTLIATWSNRDVCFFVLTLPYVSQVFAILNVLLQQKQQRMEAQAFRMRMLACPIPADGDGMLYALYGDPDHLERGGHRYWLIMVQKNPYAAPKGLKCAQGKTINAGNWTSNTFRKRAQPCT
jgi:hypothetical protein